jgi:hypothetical protein
VSSTDKAGCEIAYRGDSGAGAWEADAESPHAVATPMMARARKWTARCSSVGIFFATVVLVAFFCLVLVVLVFWVLV